MQQRIRAGIFSARAELTVGDCCYTPQCLYKGEAGMCSVSGRDGEKDESKE